ncbi:hypothetical protein EIP86_003366 [Pleurotus ostreatoroseus]|nr:hypothetical protein EIP86_003366 [Pleurotus ostreatoroseus]
MFSLKSFKAYIKRKSSRSKKLLGSTERLDINPQDTPIKSDVDDSEVQLEIITPIDTSPTSQYQFQELLYDACHHPDVLQIRCDMKMEVPGVPVVHEMRISRVFSTPIRAKKSSLSICSEIVVEIKSASPSPPPYASPKELCASPTIADSSSSLSSGSSTSTIKSPLLSTPPPSTPVRTVSATATRPQSPCVFDTPKKPAATPVLSDVLRLFDFSEVSFIGAGSFGKVHLVQHSGTRMEVALKSVRKDPEIERAIRREQSLLLELAGARGVLELLGSFHDENNYYLVTPFYERGDLAYEIGRWDGCIPLELATYYAAEILQGIKAIHALGIVHRDIKPENIFLDDRGRPVIGDFGLAESVAPTGCVFDPEAGHVMLFEVSGTVEYMAPEVWRGKAYAFPVDVFAWAVTVFEMFVGRAIWRRRADDDLRTMARRTILGTMESWLGRHTLPNGETFNMLQALLRSDAEHRPKIEHIMAHPFFATIDWKSLSRGEIPPPDVGEPPEPSDDSDDPFADDKAPAAADSHEPAENEQYTESFMEIGGGMFYDEENDPFPEFNYTCPALCTNQHGDASGRINPLLSHGSSADLLYERMDLDLEDASASPSPCCRVQANTQSKTRSEPELEHAIEDGEPLDDADKDDMFFDVPLQSDSSLHRLADGPSSAPASSSPESPSPADLPLTLPTPSKHSPTRSASSAPGTEDAANDNEDLDDEDYTITEIFGDEDSSSSISYTSSRISTSPSPSPPASPARTTSPRQMVACLRVMTPALIFEVINAPAQALTPTARRDARLPAAGQLALSLFEVSIVSYFS